MAKALEMWLLEENIHMDQKPLTDGLSDLNDWWKAMKGGRELLLFEGKEKDWKHVARF